MGRAGRHRTKRKEIDYTPAESAKLEKKFAASACRTMTEYIRVMSLGLPLKVNYRDISLDSLIDELIILRCVMEGIRSDLTISPNQLIQIVEKLTEIYLLIDKIADHVCKNSCHPKHIPGTTLSRE